MNPALIAIYTILATGGLLVAAAFLIDWWGRRKTRKPATDEHEKHAI